MTLDSTAPAADMVWIVMRWECGFGGDDHDRIVGVYATADAAYAQAAEDDDVAAYPVVSGSLRGSLP